MDLNDFERERVKTTTIVMAVLVLAACTPDAGTTAAVKNLEATVMDRWEQDGDDRRLYVTGMEAKSGNRIEVSTQLEESQTGVADGICGTITAVAYEFDELELSGVDVAAAGGRHIASCVPRI